jgi:hypothetical protein
MKIFLIGSLVALLPSALAVLWLMWRSSSLQGDRKVGRTIHDRNLKASGRYSRLPPLTER